MFVGEYDRSVDGNGRLALPSAFRDALGERCYVTRAPEGCLAVMSVDEFTAGALECLEIWRPSRYRTVRVEDGVTQPGRVWKDED